MAQLPQNKTGYIRGVRGVVVTALEEDGTPKTPEELYGIKTAQEVGVSVQIESGEEDILRGGDKLLARIKEHDTVVGAELSLKNARFDAKAMEMIAGGTLIEEAEGEDTRIVGWEAPTIEEQQVPPIFKAEVYAANFSAGGVIDGFVKYSFPYCKATFGNESLQDQSWAIPEMKVDCTESPLGGGAYRKEFVSSLPTELIS